MAFVMKRLHICICLSLAFGTVGASGAGTGVLPELAEVLGGFEVEAIEGRVAELEEALRPIFASMPHNAHGKIGQSVVRYLLHRLFMQRGWSVRGLEPSGQGWSVGSPTEMLGQEMPRRAVEIFDARLRGEGLDLREVATLASTFKHVLRGEMLERLRAAYRNHLLEQGASLTEEEADRVLYTYVASYVTGKRLSGLSQSEVGAVEAQARKEYANFPQDVQLALDAKRELLGQGAASFAGLARAAEEFAERFGRSEDDYECRPRRQDLLGLEHRGSGRVRLSDFYRAALHEGKWQFGESSGYLRQLGALDESDPSDLQVIIPNYINSKSNCVDASRYYSVCCISECDALLGQLERAIGSPSATPSELASLVAALPSASVPANRSLPAPLLRRLEEVAEGNGGQVPLHGRLFAQWMHHAYPRECPFPHLSGTINPLRVEEWAAEPGNEVVASHDEMTQHIEAPRPHYSDDEADDDGECAPWMEDEEILAPHSPASLKKNAESSVPVTLWALSAVALLLAILSGAVHIVAPKQSSGTVGSANDKAADFAIVYTV